MEALAALLRSHAIDSSSLACLDASTSVPIYHLSIPFSQRAASWSILRNLVAETGYWPVLISDMYGLMRVVQRLAHYNPHTTLDEAADLDLPTYLLTGNPSRYLLGATPYTHIPQPAEVIAEVLAAYDEEYDYLGDEFISYRVLRAQAELALTNSALWEQKSALTLDAQLGLEIVGPPTSETTDILLVPTARCWEVAAFFPGYPRTRYADIATTVRLLQDWNTRYGAEVVELGWSTLTLRATQPPQAPGLALVLAWEHAQYCPDIATMDIVQRAVALAHGAAWSFWWD